MRSIVIRSAAAAAIGLGALAYAQQQPNQRDRQNASPQQQLDQVKRQLLQEFAAEGDRRVEVREAAIWGLGELPPTLMQSAFENLAKDPERATRQIMQAAGVLELQSSLMRGQASNQLLDNARQLRALAFDVHFRQVLTEEQLRQPFARASLAAARYYQEAAQQALERNEHERVGYSLRSAAEYLAVAHTFAGTQPTPEVSQAAYNAQTAGQQIVQNTRPTTYDVARGDWPVRLLERGQQDQPQQDRRQPRPGDVVGRSVPDADTTRIPQDTDRIVNDLRQAIQQATDALPRQDQRAEPQRLQRQR